MPSFGSVMSDQLDVDGVAGLVGVADGVADDDPDVGASLGVCDPAPGLVAVLVAIGLGAVVAAVSFDFEHPERAPIRRNVVKTAAIVRRSRLAVRLSTFEHRRTMGRASITRTWGLVRTARTSKVKSYEARR